MKVILYIVAVATLFGQSACVRAHGDPAATAPPHADVIGDLDVTHFKVDHPEQFPLVTATPRVTVPELLVTGTVGPDVGRNVPVISLASGRVVALHARVGDTVKAGQVLLTVRSDDILGGTSDYHKAQADELLARVQLQRAKDLYEHGAISKSDLEVAENVEAKAKVDMENRSQHLRLLGSKDPDRPSGLIDITAPVAGVITDQQVTAGAGLQAFGSTAFTISDLSHVWIICDAYENDLPNVREGDTAEIRLNAYPDQAFKGTISNIGSILDPSLRTAKVRIDIENPGLIRLGMFVTARLHGQKQEIHTVVPAAAILHLHDRDFIYVPASRTEFRRVEVMGGPALPGGMQELTSGIPAGQVLVADALILEHAVEQ
jgi:cobalt-zinc-cadmium efflux system membrane fusion protein